MAITKVYLFIAIIMLLMLSPARYAAAESNALSASGDLQSIAQGLIDPNFQKKSEVIESIARSNALQALPLLKVLLAGNLYYQPTPLQLVSVVDQQGQPLATDMLTGQVLVAYNADAFKKITVNNRLRGHTKRARGTGA
ncbi:MAG: branched-chain amino acid transport system permease protein [Halothiobacillaceae bacterium]|nr:MAG: branched-chain amino acid transport system permease protein [Halothiobacillaceae bacterium]